MNKTQERALNWLIAQGNKKNEIIFKQSSPCFYIKDKQYDVKRLYSIKKESAHNHPSLQG